MGQVGGLIEVNWSDVRRAPGVDQPDPVRAAPHAHHDMDRGDRVGTVPAKPSARPSFFGHAFPDFRASARVLGDRSAL
jgi:hypothetical protein